MTLRSTFPVKHSAGEYVREDAYTNTVEGYLSIFKRGFKGIYQHCAEHHLHRYLAEYHSRYNNRVRLGVSDYGRTGNAFKGIFGKRLIVSAVIGLVIVTTTNKLAPARLVVLKIF